MGADSVYFYYGVRRTVAPSEEEQIRQLENDSHPIYNLAFDHKLHVAWGCLTDGADYFMLIGNEIGRFGIEGVHEQSISEARLAEIVEKTRARLKEAGIAEPPAFHIQLQAQYRCPASMAHRWCRAGGDARVCYIPNALGRPRLGLVALELRDLIYRRMVC